MFDVAVPDLHREIHDELDQEPVPLSVEEFISQMGELLLRRYVVNVHVSLLDALANDQVSPCHVFSTRPAGLVSG